MLKVLHSLYRLFCCTGYNDLSLFIVIYLYLNSVSAAGVVLIELAAPSGKEVATPISEVRSSLVKSASVTLVYLWLRI